MFKYDRCDADQSHCLAFILITTNIHYCLFCKKSNLLQFDVYPDILIIKVTLY
jgi:hypothetical protein